MSFLSAVSIVWAFLFGHTYEACVRGDFGEKCYAVEACQCSIPPNCFCAWDFDLSSFPVGAYSLGYRDNGVYRELKTAHVVEREPEQCAAYFDYEPLYDACALSLYQLWNLKTSCPRGRR